MASKKKIIVGNWKMNPQSLEEAKIIFAGVKKTSAGVNNIKTIICPPFVYLNSLSKSYSGKTVSFGAQNVFWKESGSFTGEISPKMIKDLGGKYVIVGHSERRAMGETNEAVNQKILSALDAGLCPIVCVGEEKRDPEGAYFHFLKDQITSAFKDVSRNNIKNILVAYEPVWAIGKSEKEAITPQALNEMVIFIRKNLIDHFKVAQASSVPVLYGGSVSSSIAGVLMAEGGVQGLLVGRQSLDSERFSEILKLVDGL